MQTGKRVFVIVYLLIIIFAIIGLLYGCSSVKRVLGDPKKIDLVWERASLQGRCLNDSVYTTDSFYTIATDTIYGIDYLTDTAYINGETVITKRVTTSKVINHYKTVTVNNNTVVKDVKQLNKYKEIIENLKSDLELARSQRNKWTFRFFALLAIVAIIAFRKPILTFLSGGWSKVLKLIS